MELLQQILGIYLFIVFIQLAAVLTACYTSYELYKRNLLFPLKQWQDYLNPLFIVNLVKRYYFEEE